MPCELNGNRKLFNYYQPVIGKQISNRFINAAIVLRCVAIFDTNDGMLPPTLWYFHLKSLFQDANWIQVGTHVCILFEGNVCVGVGVCCCCCCCLSIGKFNKNQFEWIDIYGSVNRIKPKELRNEFAFNYWLNCYGFWFYYRLSTSSRYFITWINAKSSKIAINTWTIYHNKFVLFFRIFIFLSLTICLLSKPYACMFFFTSSLPLFYVIVKYLEMCSIEIINMERDLIALTIDIKTTFVHIFFCCLLLLLLCVLCLEWPSQQRNWSLTPKVRMIKSENCMTALTWIRIAFSPAHNTHNNHSSSMRTPSIWHMTIYDDNCANTHKSTWC